VVTLVQGNPRVDASGQVTVTESTQLGPIIAIIFIMIIIIIIII
jgi:hypothetical protein